jgi:glycosyltransferase involved in cell wall biosynthesis
MNPKVSIVLPVFNGSNYLKQAINSALAQDYNNFEVIVINDGSNDDLQTEKIALSYGKRIIYHYQDNKGVAYTWNKGVELSTGDYISFLSHDDLYETNKLSAQINLIKSNELQNTIIYSNWVVIDDNSQEKQRITLPNPIQKQFYFYVLLNQTIHGCTLLIPKSIFPIIGNFNETLLSTCDYDFILRAAKSIDFLLCPEFLVKGRKHNEQYTYKLPNHNLERQHFFSKYIKLMPIDQFIEVFSEKDRQAYITSLFMKLLGLGYPESMLYLLKQTYSIYEKNSQLLPQFLYILIREMSKVLK